MQKIRTINLDLDALRVFVTGVELGSFARAAGRVHRSPSAVSAQLKKLEEQAGAALLRKSGRTLELTEAGALLLGYARRMLSLNDEALLAIGERGLQGAVRLGLQEDFSETLLTEVLGAFSRACPEVRIEATVGRNAGLLDGVREGRLDLALAWDTGVPSAHMTLLGDFALEWIGARDSPAWTAPAVLPLASLDAPCRMRHAAIEALDAAGMAWRIAYSSPSLSGIWAAVGAGLGVAVRTRLGLPSHLAPLPPDSGLPPLPRIGLAVHRASHRLPEAADRLHAMVLAKVRQATAQLH